MKAKDIPPMQTALADLAPHFTTFYDAFEFGTNHGKSYFEEQNAPIDLWLHANLVRFCVRRYLNQRDLKTEYEPENLANSGIQLTIKQWFIRMRKSAHGEVPLPGRSKKLQGYYQQALSDEFSVMHNLLLLWNATSNGDFKGLSLVYPLSAGVMKWRAEIPHPAESMHLTTTYQAAFDELGDLDIEALEDENENEAVEQ